MTDLAAALAAAQADVKEVNIEHGWFDTDRTVGDDVSLLHSEVSEFFEAFRDGRINEFKPVEVTAENLSKLTPIGVQGNSKLYFIDNEYDSHSMPAEAADIFIRLLDTCERRGIDLAAAYERKLAYNRQRSYRHGGKAI